MNAKGRFGKPWLFVLAGWLMFIVGHACVVGLRALSLRSGHASRPYDPSGYSELPFLITAWLAQVEHLPAIFVFFWAWKAAWRWFPCGSCVRGAM
jgi:hypothetical protein